MEPEKGVEQIMLTRLENGSTMSAMRENPGLLQGAQDFILNRLRELKMKGQLAEAARKSKINKSRFSEMLAGQRFVSFYYVDKMIRGGIMTAEEILAGRKLEELSESDRLTYFKFKQTDRLTRLLIAAEAQGIDVETVLSGIVRKETT